MDHDRTPGGNPEPREPAKPRPPRTEKEFLEQEAADARLAMGRALLDLKSNLQEAVSPSAWVQEFPWASLAVGAGAGLAAGYFLVPARGKSVPEAWKELAGRFSPASEKPAPAAAPAPPRKSMLASLAGIALTAGLKALSTAMTTALTAARQAEIAASVNGQGSVAAATRR